MIDDVPQVRYQRQVLGIRHYLFGLLLAVLGCLLPTSASALELKELAKTIRPSVVHLSVRGARGQELGTGTGFLVSESGRVVTNHHVIATASAAVGKLADGREVAVVGVLAKDPEHDLALVQLAPGKYQALKLTSSKALAQGDEVVIVGSPRGLQGTLSTGIISALRDQGLAERSDDEERKEKLAAWQLQHTAAISPGSSGSPIVLRRSGEVVGIAVGIDESGRALNFGVRAEYAIELLGGVSQETELQPLSAGKRSVGTNLLISFLGLLGAGALIWLVSRLMARGGRKKRRAG